MSHIKNLGDFFGGAPSLEGGDNFGKMGFLECPCYIHVVCLEPFVFSSYYGYISCPYAPMPFGFRFWVVLKTN